MTRTATLVLLGFLVAGCSSGTTSAPPVRATESGASASSSSTHAPAITRAEAQRALDDALAHALASTGAFTHALSFGPAGPGLTQTGRYDADAGVWESTLRTQDPKDGSPLELRFIGTRSAFYVNSPTWTGKLKDHYYRFQAADVRRFTQATVDLSDGLPLQITVVSALKAVSATRHSAGLTVRARLPAPEAAGLANLRGGLAKLNVNLEDLTGEVPVTVNLDPKNHLMSIAMEAGALKGVSDLPNQVAAFTQLIASTVEYRDFGVSVQVHLPTADEIAPP